jgi:hypothetical protein
MANFQWNESHIEWCLKTFKARTEELSTGDIEKLYTPKKRNGEPKKGKPKGDEQTIDMQDFRNLMRLMVNKKHARVTNGFHQSKGYKIRMVSVDYPYIQEVFGTTVIETIPWVFTSKSKDWEPSKSEEFNKIMIFYMFGFVVYTHMGGDFDYIFDKFSEYPEYSEYSEYRKSFILDVLYFVSVCKILKVWIDQFGISDLASKEMLSAMQSRIFVPLLYSHVLVEHLMGSKKEERGYSRAYGYDLLCLAHDCNTLPTQLKEMLDRLEKKFDFTDEIRIHLQNTDISSWMIFFEEFGNQDVKNAVEELKNAIKNKQDHQKRVLNNARR